MAKPPDLLSQAIPIPQWASRFKFIQVSPKDFLFGESYHLSAVLEAEKFVKNQFSDLMLLVKLHTRWRSAPATEKQIRVLRRRKIKAPEGLTKGQASHLIGMLT